MMNDTFHRSGGVPVVIRRLSQAFTDVEISVAAAKFDGHAEDISWVSPDRFERFDLTSTNNPQKVWPELKRFKKWFEEQGCQLVHAHHRKMSVLMRLGGIPVVYTGHMSFPSVWWFKYLHPSRMTAVSESAAANIFSVTGQKVLACINNPVPFPESIPQIDLATARGRASCIARLEPIKGHTHLLAAWKILVDRGHRYELDLVGEGSLKAALQAQAERDGMQDLIHFKGFSSEVPKILEKSLFSILASETEGQPLVVLEAAATGRATLLTNVPGSAEQLFAGRKLKNGIAFGNAVELADAIEAWFADPEATVEEGKIFFDHFKKSHDPAIVSAQYKDLYRKIIAEVSPNRAR